MGIEETLKFFCDSIEETVKSNFIDHLKKIELTIDENFSKETEKLKELEDMVRKFQSLLMENKALNNEEKELIINTINNKKAKIAKYKEEWTIWLEDLKKHLKTQ